jgi:hypothetical protein
MSKKWGTPTWYFLHTLVEKIDSNYYKIVHNSVTNIIVNLLNNLPCPYCKDHSLQYIKKNNIYKIKTREEMIEYLFKFHNTVNKRLKHSVQNKDILDLYKKMNFLKVYGYFEKNFFYSAPLSKTFYSWRTSIFKRDLVNFLNAHRHKIRL